MAKILDLKDSPLFGKSAQKSPRAGDTVELIFPAKEDSVEVGVSSSENGVCHLRIVAPGKDVTTSIETARRTLAMSFGVEPGDLQGFEAIRTQMGDEAVTAYITSFVQQRFLGRALLRSGVLTFSLPDFLTQEAPVADVDYTFEVDAMLRPSFELSSYEPVELDEIPPKPEVSSKDVTEYLDNVAQEMGTWENDPSRTDVNEGDHVTLNIESDIDGKPVQELNGRHMPFVIGAAMLGEEFDREIHGIKPRERREFSISLPSRLTDGSMEYQVVHFKVQLDEIQRHVPARIDDAWVTQNVPEAGTLLGLRSRVRTMLEHDADAVWREDLMIACAEKLSERLEEEIDERYIELTRTEIIDQFASSLARRGISLQEYLESPNIDQAQWEASIDEQAYASLKRGFALDALADHLDIMLESQDILKAVGNMAPHGQEEVVLQGLLDSGQMPHMCEIALRLKANEWLVDHLADVSKKSTFAGTVIQGNANASDAHPSNGAQSDAGPKLTLL